jgi:uncharacterized membrane protein
MIWDDCYNINADVERHLEQQRKRNRLEQLRYNRKRLLNELKEMNAEIKRLVSETKEQR